MSNKIVITVTDSLPAGIDADKWKSDNTNLGMNNLANNLIAIASGSRPGTVTPVLNNGNATLATATVTLGTSGSSTASKVGDALFINGVAFTCVASGATGNQYNQGANDAAAAASLVSAINGSVTAKVVNLVSAANASNVVTLSAQKYGISANGFTLKSRGSGSVVVTGAGAQATGTMAFSGAATASDTVLINGTTFTAETSGATGNQWNIGASATATAANLAAAINASATAAVTSNVYASAATGTLTLTAVRPGIEGNNITIAKGTDSGSVNTVSGARLTGGTDNETQTFSGGTEDTSAPVYAVS